MRYIFVDVDTQNAFASVNGNLTVYKPETNSILTNIIALVNFAGLKNIPLLGSVDSHSFDAWEFAENGGPFPGRHAVKGTWDWLKVPGTLPKNFRFIPMADVGHYHIGESNQGNGNRQYITRRFVEEAKGGVGLYFEKEVYSMFSNPCADTFISELVMSMGGPENVTFVVFGFCTGGFCVDGAALGLRDRGYNVIVLSDATQAIDGVNAENGAEYSECTFIKAGISVMTTFDFEKVFYNA